MFIEIERELAEAWSAARMTRAEIAARLDQPVRFGDLLHAIHRFGLTLPRVPSDPTSPGVQLVKMLTDRAAHGR